MSGEFGLTVPGVPAVGVAQRQPGSTTLRRATVLVDNGDGTYSVQLGADTVAVVPVVARLTAQPVVGDQVVVALISGQTGVATPLVVGLLNPPRWQVGEVSVTFTNVAAVSGVVVTWPVPFVTTTPQVVHSVAAGANFDVLSNMQSRSATGATFRLFQNSNNLFTGTATLHWVAYGV